jgi:uncharacterized lipoprotein YehR (DUF1307 family)
MRRAKMRKLQYPIVALLILVLLTGCNQIMREMGFAPPRITANMTEEEKQRVYRQQKEFDEFKDLIQIMGILIKLGSAM